MIKLDQEQIQGGARFNAVGVCFGKFGARGLDYANIANLQVAVQDYAQNVCVCGVCVCVCVCVCLRGNMRRVRQDCGSVLPDCNLFSALEEQTHPWADRKVINRFYLPSKPPPTHKTH